MISISIPRRFQCFCHSSYFVGQSTIFSPCFPLLRFLSIIPVVTRCSSFPLLITWPKRVALRLIILFMSYFVVLASRNTISFDFFAVHEIRGTLRNNHILLPPVSFVSFFKSSRSRIHTSGLVFLCESRCGNSRVLISFSENSFYMRCS